MPSPGWTASAASSTRSSAANARSLRVCLQAIRIRSRKRANLSLPGFAAFTFLGEALFEHALDLLLDRTLQRRQEETEFRVHMHLVFFERDMAIDTGAGEVEGVAIPVVVHAESLGQFLRDFLDCLARLRRRQRMGMADVDVGHAGTPGRMRPLCGHVALRPSGHGLAGGAVSKHGPMLDFRAVDSFRLRFSNQPHADLVLGAGVHGIGHVAGGMIGPIDATAGTGEALVQLCIDRRGVWMKLGQKARAVHVNGRPVRQMAMLRVGDAIYLEGAELLLLGLRSAAATSLPAASPTNDEADARIVLRGVGGQYHGRSFTLSRPLLVGRGADCDIRIDDPAFAERHARIERSGDQVLLRDHGTGEGSMVNGELVRDAFLQPGDQVVFDAHQRFVVEAPGQPGNARDPLGQALDEVPGPAYEPRIESAPRNARRLPWLLLAALLIAVGLSALLLFGTTA